MKSEITYQRMMKYVMLEQLHENGNFEGMKNSERSKRIYTNEMDIFNQLLCNSLSFRITLSQENV